MYRHGERGRDELGQPVRYFRPGRRAADPHLSVPPVLEKRLGRGPADLLMRRTICLPIDVARDNWRPGLGAAIAFRFWRRLARERSDGAIEIHAIEVPYERDVVAAFVATATVPDLFLCVDGEAIFAAALRARSDMFLAGPL
jgi:hypothetical protein